MKKHTFKEWLIAVRPWSFPASAMPVVVTLAYLHWTQQEMNWFNGIWALLNIVIFHAAGNVWSDYFDYKHQVDGKDTYGAKTLTDGMFTPKEIYRLAVTLLIVAIIGGIGLMCLTGLPLLFIGAAGAVCTLLYPYLKYHALGDLNIFITYALLPTIGTCFVVTGDVDYQALWITLSSGLITVAILHANNTRDVESDRQAGIRTFAMNAGERISIICYLSEILLPLLIVPVCILVGLLPVWAMLTYAAFPIILGNCKMMLSLPRKGNLAIANLDERTAQLQLIFNLLLVVALAIARIV